MKTIAVCNQKGGVGKSTITYHLADAFSRAGKRTLVVDADPQGNITLALTDIPSTHIGLADALSARTPTLLSDTIETSHFTGADVVPTVGETLALVRDELVIAGAGRERRLAQALRSLPDNAYDVCIIDCPPSLDQLTVNALTAADQAVIVTQARLWSAAGLWRLVDNIQLVKASYNPDLCLAGILINQVERATSGAQHWIREVQAHAKKIGAPILWPHVPKRVALADAIETKSSTRDPQLCRTFDSLATRLLNTPKSGATDPVGRRSLTRRPTTSARTYSSEVVSALAVS